MWLLGVIVRRYIDFLILLIPNPLVSVLFYSSIPTFCSFLKCFSFLSHYKFKPEVRMQSKNTITIVHVMAGMCGMYILYVCYLE